MFRITLTVLLLLTAVPLQAIDIPPPGKRINDSARLLSPTTAEQLKQQLAALDNSDGSQIVVVTVNSLDGQDPSAFARACAKRWQLGQKGVDNWVLLLIVLKEHRIRIEVGYGLEGRLTDLASGRIIRNIITPAFRAGHYDRGIVAGTEAIIKTVQGEYTADDLKKAPDSNEFIGIMMFVLIFFVNIGTAFKKRPVLAGLFAAALLPFLGFFVFGLAKMWLLPCAAAGFPHGWLAANLMRTMKRRGSRSVRSSRRSHHSWSSRGGLRRVGFGGFSGRGGGGGGGGGASGGW